MALYCPRSSMQSIAVTSIFRISMFCLFIIRFANSVSFNFSEFQPNTPNISYQEDAFSSNGVLQLTKNQRDGPLTSSVGRAIYSQPVRLWDSASRRLTDFTTHFSFIINALNTSKYGDGLCFFLAPSGSEVPPNSTGGFLGLFSEQTAFNSTNNQIVAVEFDSFKNPWDPSADHVGININSIVSAANVTWRSSIKNGSTANAWITYNSTTKNLSVFLTYAKNPVYNGNSSLSYFVDLRDILPEWISVGFSASTGSYAELHNVLSWEFNSSLEIITGSKKNNSGFVAGIVIGSVILVCALGLTWYFLKRKKRTVQGNGDIMSIDMSIDDEFEKGTGPKRFTYKELVDATDNFTEEGKLGEGGFGGVYKGFMDEQNSNVAVKRVSRGSKQGQKEYISEVKIISRLRHRNLVRLVGWCHERGELLLVYEFMPNGSLDMHLFKGKNTLEWTIRYKIATGLASALLYLHEEWEQCVIHRDIKSSNVMLDSSYNAKLGDFGLARLVDHDLGSQTTVLAGTMGYLAPECVTTGKASKESDVYSFGVVSLEIACGRRPVEFGKPNLVEWVWELYGTEKLLDAVDERLTTDLNEQQIICLMTIGLWCCHPDNAQRPSIRQVINVLNFESPLPSLPNKLPTPMYFAPPLQFCTFSYTSSSNGLTGSQGDHTQCSCSSCTTNSSKITMSSPGSSPSVSLLHSNKVSN